jgi:hypothetical protein
VEELQGAAVGMEQQAQAQAAALQAQYEQVRAVVGMQLQLSCEISGFEVKTPVKALRRNASRSCNSHNPVTPCAGQKAVRLLPGARAAAADPDRGSRADLGPARPRARRPGRQLDLHPALSWQPPAAQPAAAAGGLPRPAVCPVPGEACGSNAAFCPILSTVR